MNMITRIAIYIKPHDLNIQYISWDIDLMV